LEPGSTIQSAPCSSASVRTHASCTPGMRRSGSNSSRLLMCGPHSTATRRRPARPGPGSTARRRSPGRARRGRRRHARCCSCSAP